MVSYDKKLKTKLERSEDRRVKLTDADRREIVLRHARGEPVRSIARAFPQVSRRLIQFVIFPERERAVAKHYKKRGQAKKTYERVRGAEWARIMREHRRYKVATVGKRASNVA